jgi:AhpD family alkylhydroperoxidase
MSSTNFMKERNRVHEKFKKIMPEIGNNFDWLLEHTFKEGALPSKFKELIALGISVTIRCEPCMMYHLEHARDKGASDEEILEAMTVGFEMASGYIVPPLRKMLDKYFD